MRQILSVFGLDVGKEQDPSALVECEFDGDLKVTSRIISFPKSCSYRWQADHIPKMIKGKPLIMDVTGVGNAFVEMLIERGLDPWMVTLVHGHGLTPTGRRKLTVGKNGMIDDMVADVENERWHIDANALEVQKLMNQMRAFRHGLTRTGKPTTGAKSGANDDLVIASGLALMGKRILDLWP